MSLADSDHILTVLGSRAGFSADIRAVAHDIKGHLGSLVGDKSLISVGMFALCGSRNMNTGLKDNYKGQKQ